MVKGVFFSVDPGGTNAVIPIAKRIIKEGDVQTINFAASFAIPLWEQSGLEYTPLPDSVGKEEISRLLERIHPDFLFTGTSENTSMEGSFWQSAKQQKIISYSIIDHWTRYQERYLVDGLFSPTDVIFTIDEVSRNEMLSLGFEKERIIVSGQPHFEKFYEFKSTISKLQFCQDNRLSQRRIVTFVSDNIAGSFPSTIPGKPVLGFDERTILSAFLHELERIPDLRDQFQILIKLHPKEPENNFSTLLSQTTIPHSVVTGGNNMDLLYHSDYVVGMFSMLLFEASLMNKPVLSLQLNSRKPISFGLNKLPVVVERRELRSTLMKFLFEGAQISQVPPIQATRKIIEVIRSHFYRNRN